MKEKDWTGNSTSVFANLGASNHSKTEREENDYYATDPQAVELLLEKENFSHCIWECACGEGHISKVLQRHGYNVMSSDLIMRDWDLQYPEPVDFLKTNYIPTLTEEFHTDGYDIVTNAPYKYATEFVEHAMDLVKEGHKVAMLLKIQFLETTKRRKLFKKYPPKTVWVFSKRINCAPNGNFEGCGSSATCYCWFVWEKGFQGKPTIDWINDEEVH